MRLKLKPKPENHTRRTLDNFFVLWPRWLEKENTWVWLEYVELTQVYAYNAWWTSEIKLKG